MLSQFSFIGFFRGDVGVSTGITFVLGDELLATLAFVRQQEIYPPVEAFLPGPFSFLFVF